MHMAVMVTGTSPRVILMAGRTTVIRYREPRYGYHQPARPYWPYYRQPYYYPYYRWRP